MHGRMTITFETQLVCPRMELAIPHPLYNRTALFNDKMPSPRDPGGALGDLVGRLVGDGSSWWAFERKANRQLHDKSLANVLFQPGRGTATNSKPNHAFRNKKHQIRPIMSLS